VHTGVFVEKPEGMRPLGRTRSKWDDDIQMNPKETCWESMRAGLMWLRIGTSDGLL
jgi:hypothetical protein